MTDHFPMPAADATAASRSLVKKLRKLGVKRRIIRELTVPRTVKIRTSLFSSRKEQNTCRLLRDDERIIACARMGYQTRLFYIGSKLIFTNHRVIYTTQISESKMLRIPIALAGKRSPAAPDFHLLYDDLRSIHIGVRGEEPMKAGEMLKCSKDMGEETGEFYKAMQEHDGIAEDKAGLQLAAKVIDLVMRRLVRAHYATLDKYTPFVIPVTVNFIGKDSHAVAKPIIVGKRQFQTVCDSARAAGVDVDLSPRLVHMPAEAVLQGRAA
jgi:hypothetical protein